MQVDQLVLEGKVILVAEDEFMISALLSEMIEQWGGIARPARTVGQALCAVREGVDGAVLDVSLADGEVYPAADALAERDLPIVFHSGHASEDALRRRYPAARSVPKPALERQLKKTLRELLA